MSATEAKHQELDSTDGRRVAAGPGSSRSMNTYGARIFDRSLGRFIFTAPGVRSPDRVGQVVGGAFATLVGRDGFREADLEVRSFVDEHGHLRPMDVTEEATMETAFRQFVAEHGKAWTGRYARLPGRKSIRTREI